LIQYFVQSLWARPPSIDLINLNSGKFPVLFLNPSPLWGPIPHSVDSFLILIQWPITTRKLLALLRLVLTPKTIALSPRIASLILKAIRGQAEVVLAIAENLTLFLMMRVMKDVKRGIVVFPSKRSNKEVQVRRKLAPIVQKRMFLLQLLRF
jgi:hypothetical protein